MKTIMHDEAAPAAITNWIQATFKRYDAGKPITKKYVRESWPTLDDDSTVNDITVSVNLDFEDGTTGTRLMTFSRSGDVRVTDPAIN